ncbi:MAG: TauD/TfdA family dioxygenase [Sneathiella sp.]
MDLDRIRFDFCKNDYAIIDLPIPKSGKGGRTKESVQDVVAFLASELELGKPYTPPLYQMSSSQNYTESGGFSHVGGPAHSSNHPAFTSSKELDLHTDGSLDSIGDVQTSILACINPASEGGDSVLFRSAAMAEKLVVEGDVDLEALFSLLALRRHTTIAERNSHADGPVLDWKGKQIVSRYCITPRDEWRYDAVPGLKEAREAFEASVKNYTGHIAKVRMLKGQAIIMNNNRISHGRTAFIDDPSRPRHIVRALFRRSVAV